MPFALTYLATWTLTPIKFSCKWSDITELKRIYTFQRKFDTKFTANMFSDSPVNLHVDIQGVERSVIWKKFTDVSEQLTASIFREEMGKSLKPFVANAVVTQVFTVGMA